MECLAICTCSNMQDKAERAFALLFPDADTPQVARGRDQIASLAERYPGTNVSQYLRAIARKTGKFAYYIKADDNGDVSAVYDLRKGRKI